MEPNPTRNVPDGWVPAVAKGGGLFAIAVALLVLVPHELVTYLASRTTPTRRDLAVVAVWVVGFVVCAVLFVAIQRPWSRVATAIAGAAAGAGVGALIDAVWALGMPYVLGAVGAVVGAALTYALTGSALPLAEGTEA